ncbi:MAG: hypothetical protein GX622_00360, partial [Bacteroidales bacterium]|nr:hypothetical protein [Bacteroidales bacterium]
MNRNEFNRFIAGIDLPGPGDLDGLRELLELFPWFHSAHLLLLRGLRENSDIRFDPQLKTSALSVNDREVLYHYLFTPQDDADTATAVPLTDATVPLSATLIEAEEKVLAATAEEETEFSKEPVPAETEPESSEEPAPAEAEPESSEEPAPAEAEPESSAEPALTETEPASSGEQVIEEVEIISPGEPAPAETPPTAEPEEVTAEPDEIHALEAVEEAVEERVTEAG